MTGIVDFRELSRDKCKFSIVSTCHLPDLENEIGGLQTRGELDKEFAEKYVPTFSFTPPEELGDAKSIVVVAMPRLPTKATFNWIGRKHTFILPPTYTAYDATRIRVEQSVAKAVGRAGYKIATPRLPLKLLAVRSGLAEYGRTNIAYVPDMGSFMRLTAVYTDMPCERDHWRQAKVMKRCADCNLCAQACPTGAISCDRFLLHAEKCLTYHNEKKGNVPFPDWIKPEWHNCLVGCMRCQAACPENKPYLHSFGETAEFDVEETRLLLKCTSRDQIPASTLRKMHFLGIEDYLDELPRNLSVLVGR